MCKILLPAFLFITTILSSNAQQRFLMGVKLGTNVATQSVKGNYPLQPGYITRVHFGVLTELKYAKFGFQGEFLYSGHGMQYDGIQVRGLKNKLDYINVPMMAKWYVTKNLSVLAGPQFGMLFDHEFQDDRNSFNYRSDDYSTIYTRFEISYGGGLEWQFENRMSIYARYIEGVTKIDDGVSYLVATKNHTFQFGVAYRF